MTKVIEEETLVFLQKKKKIAESLLKNDKGIINKYLIVERIGQSLLGIVFKAINIELAKQVVLKIQFQIKEIQSTMQYEYNIMSMLNKSHLAPQVISKGQWKDGIYIQIQMLSQNVTSFYNKCKLEQNFTKKEKLNDITYRLINKLRILHSYDIIHTDIQPQNILVKQNCSFVFTNFSSSTTNQKSLKAESTIINSLTFASISVHEGGPYTKKDDLQSLLYVIAFLFDNNIPWDLSGVGAKKNLIVLNCKLAQAHKIFKVMGQNFLKAYQYLRSILLFQEVNYEKLMNYFLPMNGNLSKKTISDKSHSNLNKKMNIYNVMKQPIVFKNPFANN